MSQNSSNELPQLDFFTRRRRHFGYRQLLAGL